MVIKFIIAFLWALPAPVILASANAFFYRKFEGIEPPLHYSTYMAAFAPMLCGPMGLAMVCILSEGFRYGLKWDDKLEGLRFD